MQKFKEASRVKLGFLIQSVGSASKLGPTNQMSDFHSNKLLSQVGITSYGKGCGQEGVPGAYTSIVKELLFIAKMTECLNCKDCAIYNKKQPGSKFWLDGEKAKAEVRRRQLLAKKESNTGGVVEKKTVERVLKKVEESLTEWDRLNTSCAVR